MQAFRNGRLLAGGWYRPIYCCNVHAMYSLDAMFGSNVHTKSLLWVEVHILQQQVFVLELSFAIHWLAAYWKKSSIMGHSGWYTTMKDDEERVRKVYM